jgi:hypothetical protein
MLRAKVQWFILGFLMACIIGIPYHMMVMNKYEERCMIAEVVIAEPFSGGSMRVQGEQMVCGSNWKTSHMYFPGFDEYLGRMWQDELKKNPLVEKEREE